jgi:hypothetical protein
MYFSTQLANKTLMSVNRIWNAYNEFCSVLDGVVLYFASGGDEADHHYGYEEKGRKEH